MNEKHRVVQAVLEAAGVLDLLSAYDPVVAGTVPIGLDGPGSDVDVLCEAGDLDRFARDALALSRWPGYSLHRRRDAAPPAVVCRFTVGDLPVEVFAQPVPVRRQRAYRHMQVEGRLLALAGDGAAAALRALRAEGIRTEPAFAEQFALPGDTYETHHAHADWTDAALGEAVRRGEALRAGCPFCRIIAGEEASVVHRDAATMAFMNRRQGNPGHVLVVPRRHLETVFDLDAATAASLGRTVAAVARAVRRATGASDLNVWQSNGPIAGQEVAHVHVHVFPRRLGDGFFQVYPPGAAPPESPRAERDALAARVRAAMGTEDAGGPAG